MTTVIMRTTEGDIKINLFDDKTPETVANFLGLATTVPTEWLNGHHTIFGEVADDESKAVVDKLDSVATDRSDAPLEPVGITSIEVLK